MKKPPEKVTIYVTAHACTLAKIAGSHAVPFVPESRLAAVEAERDELTEDATRLHSQLTDVESQLDLVIDANKAASKILEDAIRERKAAEAERDALREERDRLLDWKASAMDVMSGLQDLGRALGVPLGHSITAAESAQIAAVLRARVEELEAGLPSNDDIAAAIHNRIGHDEQLFSALRDGIGVSTLGEVVDHVAGMVADGLRAHALLSGGSREEPRPDTGETCPTCEGSGQVEYECDPVEPRWRDCPACGGSGRRDTTEEDHDA
ncbi:MAG: hypothetical protein RIF41_07560 [Polyangiaceae bacterium]